ncbi:MAG: fused DSP-PTPase phosphatase/NAD kinase-like protein [bacterium]
MNLTLLSSITLAAVIVIALCVWRHKLYYHFRAVEKGKLYRSGLLSPLALKLICRRHRIKTVVNLLEAQRRAAPYYRRQVAFCAANGIKFVSLPLTVPPSVPPPPPPKFPQPSPAPSSRKSAGDDRADDGDGDQVRQFLDLCDHRANHPILLHCKQGVLRTGILVAAYQRHYHNMDNRTIYDSMPRFGHDFESERYRAFREFILNDRD